MSSTRHGAGKYHPCVRCTIRFEDVLQRRKSRNSFLSATTETHKKVESLKEIARMVKENSQKKKRRWALDEVLNLLSEQCLAEWPSFLADMSGETTLVIEELYSVFTSDPLHGLHVRVPKLSKNCLTQFLTSNDV